MNQEVNKELNTFIDEWQESPTKTVFVNFMKYLNEKDELTLNFIPRPGLTYSLRAAKNSQKDKDLFVMVDVIEGEPRWLSICFYGDMITDPEEKGDFVPQGLLGEDAMCFDLEEVDDRLVKYMEARVDEAYQSAG